MNLFAFGVFVVLLLVVGFMLVRLSRPEAPLRLPKGKRSPATVRPIASSRPHVPRPRGGAAKPHTGGGGLR